MLRTRRFAAVFALAVCAVSPLAIPSADAKKPVIISSSSTATALTINGEDLAPGAASVLLGSFGPLAVTGQTPTQLVVTLPGGLTPGNYALSVQIGNGKGNIDESVVTIGPTGPPSGGLGAAEFVRTIQSPNNSVPPGTAFTIDTQIINSIPTSVVQSAGAGGTVFTLSDGIYALDYEMSLEAAGSVGVYTGPSAGSLVLDTNTIAGSSTGTTWIHGRAIVQVATSLVVAISSVVGTAAVVTPGTAAGFYMIRLTILKIS